MNANQWAIKFDELVTKLAPGKTQRDGLSVSWSGMLWALYSEPHRHYHGVRHIANLLERLDALRPFSEGERFRPGMDRVLETEVAIWFHDAIYVVGDPRNEERSAAFCRSFLVSIEALELDTANFPGNVNEAILATKHDGTGSAHNAARLMVDLDLAGFADPWDDFEENNRRIAAEYAAVPPEAYRWGRIKFLAGLLGPRPLYSILTELEAPARANIERHIAELARP